MIFLFLDLLDNNDFIYVYTYIYTYIHNIHICIYLKLYFSFLGHAPQHVGWNPCPLQWKHRVLSTGPREKSPYIYIFPLIFLKGTKTKLFSYMILDLNHFNLKWITLHKKLNVSLPEPKERHKFIHWNVCQQYSLKFCLWMTFLPLFEKNRSSMSLAGLYKFKASQCICPLSIRPH